MQISVLKELMKKDISFYKNILSLGLIQVTNFIIPLITFPYLVRTVGIEQYGVISYGLTIITYLSAFVEFGFMVSATRLVAIYKNDKVKLSYLFSTVTIARVLLFFVAAAALLISGLFIEKIGDHIFMYFLGLSMLLSTAIFPLWFFQGVEQMKYVTYFNIAAKIILILLLFVVVTDSQDYFYVPGIYGIANVLTGIYGNWYVLKNFNLKFTFSSLHDIFDQYKAGVNLFYTNFVVVLLNNSNVIILSIYVSDTLIGSYSFVEKIVFALWQVLAVFSQATYPILCRLSEESHEKIRKFLARTFLPFFGMIATACIGISFFAPEIVLLLSGKINADAVNVLRVMIFTPLIVCLNIPAYQTQLAYSLTKDNTKIYAVAALLNIALCALLVRQNGIIGAAISMLIVQTIVTLGLNYVTEIKFKQYSLLRN
ncbi:flippase [Spirosoma sp. KUDC1026]|uniref:flippase n=1 Tax=Spirosoma sp. KUDC1026 TaxID=2745947 RepID=UPI00159BD207|nr:flippase [Spirosoma sp. KUDC1026]QKZ11935.1 flippase [Spirosoma sp. KUDC1026]